MRYFRRWWWSRLRRRRRRRPSVLKPPRNGRGRDEVDERQELFSKPQHGHVFATIERVLARRAWALSTMSDEASEFYENDV